jgi:hypothetical protein
VLRLAAGALAMAVILIAAAFFTAVWLDLDQAFFQAVVAPGVILWKLSNWVCPPSGARCFLLSERQGAHHLWALICYVVAWWGIFFATLMVVRRLRKRGGADTPTLR